MKSRNELDDKERGSLFGCGVLCGLVLALWLFGVIAFVLDLVGWLGS